MNMRLLGFLAILGLILPALATISTSKATKVRDSTADRQKLRDQLFDNYDKLNRPDNSTLSVGLALISFDVEEATNSIKAHGWLRLTWSDERLKWDEDEAQVSVLRIGPEEAWRPDLVLYNSIDLREVTPCGKTNMILYSSGKVLQVPPCTYQAYCEDLTTKDAPTLNAEHVCELKFGSWTFDGFALDTQIYENETEVDMTDFRDSSGWKVLGTEAIRTVKYYDCCAEPYVSISFKIRFTRKSA